MKGMIENWMYFSDGCIFEVSDISDALIFRQIKSGMLTELVLTEASVAPVEVKP